LGWKSLEYDVLIQIKIVFWELSIQENNSYLNEKQIVLNCNTLLLILLIDTLDLI